MLRELEQSEVFSSADMGMEIFTTQRTIKNKINIQNIAANVNMATVNQPVGRWGGFICTSFNC